MELWKKIKFLEEKPPLSADTDEALILEVQKGNQDLFGTIIERYEEKLIRYGRRFLSEREDVRDLVQESFIQAYMNIKNFDTSRKFSSWMYRIAHNTFVTAIRKKSKMPTISFDVGLDVLFPHPVAKETADDDIHRGELRGVLEKHLDGIDVKYREPLVLYFFEELDYKEIAEILRIPVATVGIRLRRGKAILKENMSKNTITI